MTISVEEIKRRWAGVPQAEWSASHWDGGHCSIDVGTSDGETIFAGDAWHTSEHAEAVLTALLHAHEDIPALIKELEEVTKERDELRHVSQAILDIHLWHPSTPSTVGGKYMEALDHALHRDGDATCSLCVPIPSDQGEGE